MWWLINRFPWTMVTWHYDSSRRNLFLEDYHISASLFVFRGSNTKLFFAIYLLYFYYMLWHERNTPTHLTSDMRLLNDITSFSHLLCSYTCIHSLSTWHRTRALRMRTPLTNTGSGRLLVNLLTPLEITTTHLTSDMRPPSLSHTGSDRTYEDLLPTDIFTPIFGAHSNMHAYIKGPFANFKYDFVHV